MNSLLHKLQAWNSTKQGMLIFAILELILAYVFVSLAIDKGNIAYYILTLLCLFGFLKNLIKLTGYMVHGKR